MTEELKLKKLPKWAQIIIGDLEIKIQNLEREKEILNTAHAVLFEHEWFTVHGPNSNLTNNHTLFKLSENHAQEICNLRTNDILLIGRAKNDR